MTTSDQINEISAALSKAQGEMEGAKKESENPHFRSKYANLSSVWDACRAALSKHGLAVVQTVDSINHDIFVNTRLVHASGQWIQSSMPILMVKEDMQGMGSAITYARRYALAAICGVAQDDDDAEGTKNTGRVEGSATTHTIKNVTQVKKAVAKGEL